jgi:hypothetical protein
LSHNSALVGSPRATVANSTVAHLNAPDGLAADKSAKRGGCSFGPLLTYLRRIDPTDSDAMADSLVTESEGVAVIDFGNGSNQIRFGRPCAPEHCDDNCKYTNMPHSSKLPLHKFILNCLLKPQMRLIEEESWFTKESFIPSSSVSDHNSKSSRLRLVCLPQSFRREI